MKKNMLRNAIITGIVCFSITLVGEYINFRIQGENSNPAKHMLILFITYVVAVLLIAVVSAVINYIKKRK